MGLFIHILISMLGMFSLRGDRELNEWFTFTAESVDSAFGRPTPTITVCYEHVPHGRGVIRQAFPDTEVTLHPLTAGDRECLVCTAMSNGKHTPDVAAEVRQHFVERITAQKSVEAAHAKAEEERVLSPEVKEQAQALDLGKEEEMEAIRVVEHQNGVTDIVASEFDEDSLTVNQDKLVSYATTEYIFRALNEESEHWKMWTFDIPKLENGDYAVDQYLRRISSKVDNATIAWATTSSLTVVTVYNEDGTSRDWMELKNFIVKPANKMAKRIATVFGQQTYLSGRFHAEVVDPSVYHAPTPGAITIGVLPTPEDKELLVDGIYFMRPNVRDEMVDEALNRIESDIKREKLEEMLRVLRNNGRLIFSGGTLKGDNAMVAENHDVDPSLDEFIYNAAIMARNVDILTFDCNVKDGVSISDENVAIMHMFPQKQMHSIRTNPQSVAHFHDVLFNVADPNRDDDLNIIQGALRNKMQHFAKKVMRGESVTPVDPVVREKDDQLRSTAMLIDRWLEQESTLHTSLHLSQMNARQVVMMFDKWAEQDRHYPVPYALSASLMSETVYSILTGRKLGLAVDEFVLRPYGIIVADDAFEALAIAWGGADQDDHLDVHFRVADDSEGSIHKGDTLGFIVRNPIGTTSDGNVVASEYNVLKVADDVYTRRVVSKFGMLPHIKLADRPVHVLEIDAPDREPREVVDDDYTPDVVKRQVFEAAKSKGTFGIVNLLMTTARLHDIPFNIGVSPEFLIDVCEQTRHPEDLKLIDVITNQMRALMKGKNIDQVMVRRLKLKGTNPVDGLYHTLAQFHIGELNNYKATAALHLTALGERFQEIATVDDSRMFDFFDKQVERHLDGDRSRLSDYRNILAIADNMAKILKQHPANEVKEAFVEAFYAVGNRMRKNTRSQGYVLNKWVNTDQPLTQPDIYEMYLDALSDNVTERTTLFTTLSDEITQWEQDETDAPVHYEGYSQEDEAMSLEETVEEVNASEGNLPF